MDFKKIPLAPMPRVLIDLGNGELFPKDQIPENVWDASMNLFFKSRFQLIDTVDQNVGEYTNGHGRFKITREQQPFDGVCAPVVYHAEEIKTILPLVLFFFPDTEDVINQATKESNGMVHDLLDLGYEIKEIHLVSGDFDTGVYASDNGEIKIRRNCRNWSGYEIVEEA